jgi:trimethylamine--corrinoid protein Co-methyltransferase
MEKVLTTLPLVLSEIDVIQGIGLIESSMTLSLEQMIIDSEIAGLCRRMKEGIEVSNDLDFIEDVKNVGQGGHFLKQKNTRTAFRTDQFSQAMLCDRDSYDGWASLGRREMIDLARDKVKEILGSEPKNPMPEKTEKQIAEIMEEAKRKLCEG